MWPLKQYEHLWLALSIGPRTILQDLMTVYLKATLFLAYQTMLKHEYWNEKLQKAELKEKGNIFADWVFDFLRHGNIPLRVKAVVIHKTCRLLLFYLQALQEKPYTLLNTWFKLKHIYVHSNTHASVINKKSHFEDHV